MGGLSFSVVGVPSLEVQGSIPDTPETEAGGSQGLRKCSAMSGSTRGAMATCACAGADTSHSWRASCMQNP